MGGGEGGGGVEGVGVGAAGLVVSVQRRTMSVVATEGESCDCARLDAGSSW